MHPQHTRTPFLSLALPLALLGACAEGGGSDSLAGDVTIGANHHMFSLRGVNRFEAFPVVANDQLFTTNGTLTLQSDSSYTVDTGSGASSPTSYFLRQNGQFDLLSLGGFNSPNTILTGGYGLDGNTDHFAFVDRNITANSRSLGLYFGSRHLEVDQDLEATDWHLFSLHVLLPATAIPDPDQVARAAWGTVRAENTDADPEQELVGTGRDSSGADLNYGGSIAVLNTIGQANLLVEYRPTSGPGTGTSDPRTFSSGIGVDADGGRVVFALDGDSASGEMGLLTLVEKRTGTLDLRDIAGSYEACGLTFFVNPGLATGGGTNSGTDAAAGILTLSESGAFRFQLVGVGGADFAYTGTISAADDGALTFTVNETGDQWFGAICQAGKTLVALDGSVENNRTVPELSMFVCIRKPD